MDAIIPPHPTPPPNHILSMCGDHENRNAYTVVEIRAKKHAIKPIPMTKHEMQFQITYKQLNPFLFFSPPARRELLDFVRALLLLLLLLRFLLPLLAHFLANLFANLLAKFLVNIFASFCQLPIAVGTAGPQLPERRTPEYMPEHTPNRMSEDMPARMPDDMSDDMPEVCQKKCQIEL